MLKFKFSDSKIMEVNKQKKWIKELESESKRLFGAI